MKNHNEATVQTPHNLLDELHGLVKEAEKMIGDSAADTSSEAIGALRARFEAAQESLSALYGRARKNVVAGAQYTDEVVRANPYQSIAIAAGVGLLVGVLVGRRNA